MQTQSVVNSIQYNVQCGRRVQGEEMQLTSLDLRQSLNTQCSTASSRPMSMSPLYSEPVSSELASCTEPISHTTADHDRNHDHDHHPPICWPVSSVDARWRLRSAAHEDLVIPRTTTKFGALAHSPSLTRLSGTDCRNTFVPSSRLTLLKSC